MDVLGRRGFALESAAARVCRELDIGVPDVPGCAPAGGGGSRLSCAGTGHLTHGAPTNMGPLWQLLVGARKRAALNWLANTGARSWWSLPAKLVGAGRRSAVSPSAT